MIVSYAQNAEDVVLSRAFVGVTDGFYVDVGAGHPVFDSVTKHFYDLGWSGVNIEPLGEFHLLLEQERPRDVNVRAGLGESAGELTLYEAPASARGGSTFVPAVAARFVERDEPLHETRVPVTTLAAICAEHVGDRPIDFLKVDVEGYEREVLLGGDWDRWRPRVLVIEATAPDTSDPSHESWEPLVLDAGYDLTLFDGLNRFYVRDDEPTLRDALSMPANVFDDYIPFRYAYLEERNRECEQYARSLEAQFREIEEYAQSLEAQRECYVAYIEELERKLGPGM